MAGRAARGFVLVAAVAGLPGCLISADHVATELVRVCTEDLPLVVERRSDDQAGATVTFEDLDARLAGPGARAWLDSLTLTPVAAADALDFVDQLVVTVEGPGSDLPRVTVAEAAAIAGQPLTARGDRTVDLVGYLTAERLIFDLALGGDAPDRGVAVRLDACLDVEGVVITD